MKATVSRHGTPNYAHQVRIRGHELTLDEPEALGGRDAGPTPQELLAASLASCVAITVEMYAERKGWELGEIEVECEYESPERDAPANFHLTLRVPQPCSEEQLERLTVIAGKCPVRRILEGEVSVEERVELTSPSGS